MARASTTRDLAFRPDGAQIAVISREKIPTCKILDAESGRLVQEIKLPAAAEGLAWSPDGTLLATTCLDRNIYLWDIATGTLKCSFVGSTNLGLRTAFHPTGTLLASNGWEARLRLWDPVLGRPVLSLTSSSQVPYFSHDGRIVVSREDQLTTYQVDPALEYRTFAHAFGATNWLWKRRRSATTAGCWRWARTGAWRSGTWPAARSCPSCRSATCRHVMFEASGDLITSGRPGVHRWPVRLDPERGEFRIGPPRQLPLPAGILLDRGGPARPDRGAGRR